MNCVSVMSPQYSHLFLGQPSTVGTNGGSIGEVVERIEIFYRIHSMFCVAISDFFSGLGSVNVEGATSLLG
jgi:hypothetical protein